MTPNRAGQGMEDDLPRQTKFGKNSTGLLALGKELNKIFELKSYQGGSEEKKARGDGWGKEIQIGALNKKVEKEVGRGKIEKGVWWHAQAVCPRGPAKG